MTLCWSLPVVILATRVPLSSLGRLDLTAQAFLYVRQRIVVSCKNLAQESDVSDGQAQSVNLGQAFLVGKRGYMNPQLVEGRVDAAETRTTHPAPQTLQPSYNTRDLFSKCTVSIQVEYLSSKLCHFHSGLCKKHFNIILLSRDHLSDLIESSCFCMLRTTTDLPLVPKIMMDQAERLAI